MDSLGGMGSFPGDPKTQVMRQVQQEAAMQNARMLVEVRTQCYMHTFSFPAEASSPGIAIDDMQKLNEHCFERCVPKPGTSLSKGEENCFTACMEKYMSAWNTVSKQYVGRIQREQQSGAVQNL
jgi:import inner membrane translocase subunit TIM13